MGTATALLAFTSGAGAALAAPGDVSNSSGQFLSGSLFNLPLSAALDLSAETASNNGTQDPVVNQDDIDLTALSTLNVQLGGGLQLPINVADAGVLGQYAAANPDGSSVGASGAIGSNGQIGVGPTGGTGELSLSLGGLLGGLGLNPAYLSEVAGLEVSIGAVSARASQEAPAGPVGSYTIADADIEFDSATLGNVVTGINNTVTALQTALNGLEVGLEARLLQIPGLGLGLDASVNVAVPALAPLVSNLLTQNLSSGGVTINLSTGVVSVDLATLNNLNNLPPSTNLLGAPQLTAITNNITSLVAGLVNSVGATLQSTINGIAVTGGVTALTIPVLSINTSIGGLLANSSAGISLLGLNLPVGGILTALLGPITTGGLGNVLTSLTTTVVNPVINLVVPAISPVLNAAIGLTANVQSTTAGVFTETALRVTVLPATRALVGNLATATVGPNFAVPNPAITSISPNQGPENGGTSVTLTGTSFTNVTSVTIGGNVVPASALTVTPTTIVFATPAHAAGPVPVVINALQGDSAPATFTYLAVPATSTSLTPTSGPESGGTPVTITGSGFTGATGVSFDATPGTAFTVVNDTTITVTSPVHAPGNAAVTVLDPAGNSAPLAFAFLAVPATATSVAPTSGPVVGGTPVTVTGSGFLGATAVQFDGTPGTAFTVVNDTTITVTTPAGDLGAATVVVVDPAGNSAPLAFEYLAQPAIAASLTPTEGTEDGGTAVTITGSGFLGATGVTFDGTPGTGFTVVDDSTITVATPAHVPGLIDVVVVDPAGNSAPLGYTYVGAAAAIVTLDPAQGPETGGTPVTIEGSGFTNATGVTFDGLAGTDFEVEDDGTITVTSPAHAPGPVAVVVQDPSGNSPAATFTYLAVPSAVVSLTPTEGPELGGTIVTITGTGFVGASGVTFDGITGTNFTVDSDTQITVTTPANSPGDSDVVVVDAAGNSGALNFEFIASPSVTTAIVPDTGPAAGGTEVTISGTGFTGATGVTFDGTPGTDFEVLTDTVIIVTSPPGAAGTVDVVVTDPAGDSDPLDFTYTAQASVVTSLDPTSGTELGGTPVTVTGSGFLGAIGVTFDGSFGTAFTIVNDTTITVNSPAHVPGPVNVVVLDPAGNSDPVIYTYVGDAAAVVTITPDSGTELGGTPVTLEGSGFTNATGVTFDGTPGTDFVVEDDGTITVTSPAHAPGPVSVVVLDPSGNAPAVTFTYLAIPSAVTSLTPEDGTELGGTVVTITGSGFTGASGVTFDGIPGTAFAVVNDTTITVTTPANSPGDSDVVVVDAAGNSGALNFEFLAIASEATSLDPTFGPVAGGTPVTITGSGFTGATGVTFDGIPATAFTVVDDTTITVISPAGTDGFADVIVIDPAGNSEPLLFEYGAEPSIAASLTPTDGTEDGGTPVTISGSGFLGATGVTFDGTLGTAFAVVSDTQILVTTPAHLPGAVEVIVVDPAGDALPLTFTYVGEPADVATITPDEGSEAGGTPVVLEGSGFTNATGVTFDGTPGTNFVVVDDGTITVTSPAHAPGPVLVVVSDPSGDSTAVDFEYLEVASSTTSLTPDEGSELGGTPVTVDGSGFIGATAVTFDGIPGADFTIVSDTQITVVSPAHLPEVVDVIVVDGAGNSAPVDFEYLATPAVATSLNPTSGPAAGNTTVVITGSGFTGATAVEFDGVAGTGFVVDSDTQITVTSPAGEAGPANVVVIDGGGNSAPLVFEYTAQAAIATSLTPLGGTELGGTLVTITGSGFLGATGVTFDGFAGTGFTIVNDTTITVQTPAHAPGPVGVVVLDPAGNSTPALTFTYAGDPAVVDDIDPVEGPEAGGTPVTLTGSGFTGATGVTFDGTPGTDFEVVDDTTITVVSPQHLPGTVDVVVLDPTLNAPAVDFTYLAIAADADSLTPDEGPDFGGTPVTISGSGFLGATAVTFDGITGTAFTVVNDTTITVTTPANTPGDSDVVVVDATGNGAGLVFEFIASPADAATLDPTSGPAAGGTPVTITGTGFTGATGVTFDGVPATDFVVVNDTTITVTSPAGAAGPADVVVLDPEGDSDPLTFGYVAAASDVTGLTPDSGTELGGTPVTVTGTGFLGSVGVTFDGSFGTAFTIVNDTTITVATPAHLPGPANVVVLDPAGNSAPDVFTFVGVAAAVDTLDPTSGPDIGGTPVTIEGSGFTNATGVTFDGLPGTDFDVEDDGTITVTTPAHAPGAVDVVVLDPSGNSPAVTFTYLAVVSDATSLSPTEGTELGGTPVTIEGTGFTGATSVTFDGTPGTAFAVVSDTEITVVSPAHDPGIVDVVVVDVAGGNSEPLDFEFLAIASETTYLNPTAGPAAGGTPVTVFGTGFTGATAVEFDGAPGTDFVVVDDSTITVTSPAGTAGPAEVVVIDPAGDSEPLAFEYIAAAAAATSLTPTSGTELGGTPVVITGSGLFGATAVTFGGTPGTAFTVVNDTTITVTTPAHLPGPAEVVVQDPEGNSAPPLIFTFVGQPSVADELDPAAGSEAGGTPVTITGSGFTGASAVTFDGTPGTAFAVVNDTTITVITPAHLPGAADVVVVDDSGNSAPLSFEFLAIAAAADSLTPTEGPDFGGTPVEISGSGFLGATGVTFDGIPGTAFTVVSDTQITVTSPGNTPGDSDVVVVDAAGNSGALTFEYLASAADAISLDPTSGPAAGGTPVTITGTGFTGSTAVTFDGVPGTAFVVVNDTTITVTSPAGTAGTAEVIVLDPEGDSEPLDFAYEAAAAVTTSLTPTSGSELGGTPVTITGTGFLGATGVTFDGTEGTAFAVVNDTTITVTSPAHVPAAVDVVVVDPTGNSGPLAYTYVGTAAAVADIDPAVGPETGGTPVTLEGSGFTNATGVTFDGLPGTAFVVVDDDTITVTSPAHAPGPVNVIVQDPSGNAPAVVFTYQSVVSDADSLTPDEGPEIGGTPVTITGTGFLGATGVTFDGVAGTAFTVDSDTQITVTTPANAPGASAVIVVDAAGGNSGALTFEFIASAADADSVDPAFGPVAGGTPVTISGTGFTGATGVTFDGTPGTAFTVVNDTTITVTSPAGTVGPAEVIVVDPAGNSDPLGFEYGAQPSAATSLTPTEGTENGGTPVTITGSGFLGSSGVTFDGTPGSTFTVVNDTTITVTSPAHLPGAVEVVVDDVAGSSDPLAFSYLGAAAAVAEIDPAAGPQTGGTPVTLEGSGFTNATGVTFDGLPGTAFVVVDDSTITVTTPAHAPGAVSVIVQDPSGNSPAVTFTYESVASDATSLTPTEGPELGGTPVTITGTGFLGATGVTFDGIDGTAFAVVSDTSITVTTPANTPGDSDVVVVDAAGNSDALNFAFLASASEAISLSPTSGPAAGGTPVTIIGTGLTGATGVEFNGTPGTDFVVVDDTTITVTSPAGTAGTAQVIVIDPAGNTDPLDFGYTAAAATATALSPTSGTELGGTPVTITGSGFLGATGVTFDADPGTAFTIVSDTTITVTTPAHLPGPAEVVVVDPAGNSAPPLTFTFVGEPSAADELDPAEGPEAGGTPVTITGSGFTGATAVTFDGTAGTEFEVVDDSTITVTSPQHLPGTVEVIVVDESGNSAPLAFEFLAVAADATSVTPAEGPDFGGTPVTIAGTGFLGATGVTFDGIPGTDFVVVSDTEITVTTPANAPGDSAVVVVDATGNGGGLVFEFIASAAEATTIDPAFGPAAGGTPVTISGTGFTGATGVTFDGAAGTAFTVVDDTTITVTSPAGAVGPADVIVLDPVGNSDPILFEYGAQPSVATVIVPNTGTENGNTLVTIIGTGFLGATAVTFDGTPGTAFGVISDNVILVSTPAHLPGAVDVIVVDPAGDSDPLPFTYVGSAAAVAEIDPAVGSEAGGTPVTLEGSGFTNATGVTFDGLPGTAFVVVDDSTITVTSPAHAPGAVSVIVQDPSGNSTPVTFTYEAVAADATSLTPVEGPELGGTVVTITGSGFVGATAVTFDGIAGTAFSVNSDTQITVTTPPNTPGDSDVVVVDAAGNSDALNFVFLASASVAISLEPSSGPAAGGTPVTIIGTGFTGATGVEFAGVPGTGFEVVSDTEITVTTPPGAAGDAEVVVLDPAGNTDPLTFVYDAQAAIATTLSPTSGTELGGTPVTISGSGFLGATGVTFDGAAGTTFTVVNDTTITVTSPAHVPGAITVVVVDPAGNSAPLGYTYVGTAAAVTDIDPAAGPETGGTPVTLEGTGFTNATGVTFDGLPGTAFVIVDDSTITVTSPAHLPGAVSVVVQDPSGNSPAVTFTYDAVASDATSLTPDEGTELGGTLVTITGTGFTGATAVEFDGTAGAGFTVVNDTTITAVSPSHLPGEVDVVVIDAAGNSAPLDFEYLAIASDATSISPASGPAAGGTPVTIGGTGFTGATGVTFDGVPGTAFTVVNDTTITVTTPAGTAGTADVIVLDPAGNTDPIDFEYLGQPAVATALTPIEGPELGGTPVTITGSGFLGATGVTFDATAGLDFEVVNDTTITVTTPAYLPGPAAVVVVDPEGNSAPLTFTFIGEPSAAGTIAPASGPETGGTPITIGGTGFTGSTGVTFDGIPGTNFVIVDDSTITVTTPQHVPGTVQVIVVDESGNSDPLEFAYVGEAADAASIDPVDGSEAGGTPVTITGSGFLGATGVEFDGTAGTAFTVVDDTTITVVTPAHTPELVDVVVVDPTGNSDPLGYTYISVGSVIDTIAPADGDEIGGTPVTITGSGFTGATGVAFDGTPGTDFVVVNDTTITVTSPPHAPGVIDVVVIDEAGGDSEPIEFEYVAVTPVVDTVDPAEGPEAGNTLVTLTGSGFTGATAVEFDGIAGTAFTLVDDGTITVLTPSHLAATVDAVVIDEPAGNSDPFAYTYLAQPATIFALDPPSAPETGNLRVRISGEGFLGASAVTFGGVPGSEFRVLDDFTIEVVCPSNEPAIEEVMVLDDAGSDMALFAYTAIPAVPTAITPDNGASLGGTQVTLTGTGFLYSYGVEFDGIPGTAFEIIDDETITVTTPPHAAGIVDVRVTDVFGESSSVDYRYVAGVPAPNSIDPQFGSEAGGTVVTIGGAGFTPATGVTFDGIPGTDFEVLSDTQVRVTTPANTPGIAVVVVWAPAGDSDPIGFEFRADPSVATSIAPAAGLETGGAPVTLTGSGFLGASAVQFDGLAGTDFTVVNDTTITVTSPAHAPGPVSVIVVDAAGNSAPLAFTYLAAPSVVDGLDPVEGSEAGGTPVTITGSGFTGATSVTFDGVAGTGFTLVNDTTITVVAPPHAPGVIDVVVVDTPGGNSDPVDFTYLAVPADASSVTPNSGSEAGGTAVTITGSGFLGATGVEFDGLAGTNFTVVNDTTITVTTPAHAVGLIGLVVLDPAGDSGPLAYEYRAVASAADTLEPPFGPATGGTVVTITGSGFTGATGVAFDGILGTDFEVVNDTTIIVTTPAHPSGVVEVIVLDPAGDSAPIVFEYDPQPSVASSLTPVTGNERGGTAVTIRGTGFTGATAVTFDGIAGTAFTVVDDSTITVASPAHAVGPVDVIVVDPAGDSARLGFLYFAAADIGVVAPPSGPEAGGTTVTISGTCFTGATAVLFGDVEVTDFEVSADGTTITVVSPAGSGAVDVTVVGTTECGTTTEEGGYTYDPAPALVTEITPGRGPQLGGTVVTIGGSGFTGSTGVNFGGVAGTDFTVVNDTTITVRTPASGVGSVEVVVLDPAGNSSPVAFEFFGVADIDTVSPDSGPSAGGTTVTIAGQCFTGTTAVRFGNTAATSFSVNAAGTRISAVSPAGTGTVDVTVVGAGDCGSVSLEDGFSYSTPGLPTTGVAIAGSILTALLLLLGGAAILVIRRKTQSDN